MSFLSPQPRHSERSWAGLSGMKAALPPGPTLEAGSPHIRHTLKHLSVA